MNVRVLQAEDLSTLAELRLEGIRLFPDAFLLTQEEARKSDSNLLGWITSGNAIGAFDGATLVGFAGLRGMNFSMAEHRAHLGPFYVTPSHQGTGVADALIAYVLQMARDREATQIELFVGTQNARAHHFYARHGFCVTGAVPRAVMHEDGCPRDDHFMVLDLTADLPSPGPDGLRRLGPGDWRAFRDVRLEMLQNDPQNFGSSHAEWAAKAPDDIMGWLDKIHLWAHVVDGRALATAGWVPISGAVLRHRASVICVYTTPDARGRGLASNLLEALEKDARAYGILQLELCVGANNPAARAAYLAQGFCDMGKTPRALNYLGTFVDQYEMVKPIDS